MWSNLIQRIIFLFVTGPGIMGNIIIFVRHVCAFLMGPVKKPIDFIIIQLALSNSIIICSTGIGNIATIFYIRNLLDKVGCKTVIYLGRVARGLSICTTCLLSMVQAITICPKSTKWKFKPCTAWQILQCFLFFWIFNLLISSNLLYYITAVSRVNRSEIGKYVGHCYMLPSKLVVGWLFLSLTALRDVIFQSLMGWSSGYMAFCLYEHHKCVFYMHSTRFTHSFNPEIRATQSILILMTCFLFFYWEDFIFSFYLGSTVTHDSIVLYTKIVLAVGYAVLSPFVLMKNGCSHC
ncbi:LOW QUALITY PROTEIN: putative vomeronasal receptor-like protein 4 [Ctenodactylus gundi]